jgi:hypothetical protein
VRDSAWTKLCGICAVIGVTCATIAGIVWNFYDFTRPKIAAPLVGRIYPLNTHGHVVYLTSSERLWLWLLLGGFGVFALLAAIIQLSLRNRELDRRLRRPTGD